ncbi:MAG: DUF3379 family protein [Gammaproteobacteria bacterium]
MSSTMNCLEFRRRCGTEPRCTDAEFEQHLRECSRCAAFAADLRALDGLILEALRLDARDEDRGIETPDAPRDIAPQRKRFAWLGIAASVVLGMALAAGIWLSVPRVTLAGDVVEHVMHEPGSFVAGAPVPDAEVRKVLDAAGVQLGDEAGAVTYATVCLFRGNVVPHLVVRDEAGPVTVMVLREEKVSAPMPIDEEGFRGTIVPSGEGSIAILGQQPVDVDRVRARVLEALTWPRE